MPEAVVKLVLIAGAGIGGLTAALMMARAGHQVTVIERRTRLEEVGAGLQLSPNASRILISLGLGPALNNAAGQPDKLLIRRGTDGIVLANMPLGAAARARYGAPYMVVHRGDLQTILLDAVRADPAIRLAFGRTVAASRTEGGEVVATTDSPHGQETFRAALLIGSDGLWSRVAPSIGDHGEPTFSGYVAWRATVPAAAAPPPFRRQETGLWLGTGAHVVHYPLRGGRFVNIVAVLSDRDSEPGWNRPGDADRFRRRFRGWSQELHALFGAAEEWQVWSLFDRPPRKRWADGLTALLGDAAHPMLPFMAQGGAMAIEDAAVLAACLAGRPDDWAGALQAYAAERRQRVAKVFDAARFNGRAYHLPPPFTLARDMILKRQSGEGLMRRFDWLYGWAPPGN